MRPARARRASPARRPRARRRERLGLQRAPARELPPGRTARPRARACLSAGGGSALVRRSAARPAERGSVRAAAIRGRTCCGASRGRRGASSADRRAARARGRALCPRRPGRSRRARVGRLGHFQQAPAALARAPRARGCARPRPMSTVSVEAAYAAVERITRHEAKNFAYGIMVLPRAKRQAIAAIYAFARSVDDVADGGLPSAEKRAELEKLRVALDGDPTDPVFIALRDARERFAIPREPLAALVDGGLQDTVQSTYADFAELRGYCEKVAGAVGLACLPVYGSDDTEHAMTLGIALQLINIVRDVDEDQQLGRVYLPQDELVAFGVEELAPSPEFRELMAFQAERARACLAEGLRLLDSLDRRSALCVGTFAGLYRETLDRIEAAGFDVFGEKTRLSAPRKLAVVARGLLP